MVTLHILVEGGAYDAEVTSNVESLRQAFHNFFVRLLSREDIGIVVEMDAGNRNAAKRYLKDTSQYLWVDSDSKNPEDWFVSMDSGEHPIVFAAEQRVNIYFMIQEMEAWFLKQPECFDRWAQRAGYRRKANKGAIAEDSRLAGRDVEAMTKPSHTVAMIVKRYFERVDANGNVRDARYGKLSTSPAMLDAIDTDQLSSNDNQLRKFRAALETIETIR